MRFAGDAIVALFPVQHKNHTGFSLSPFTSILEASLYAAACGSKLVSHNSAHEIDLGDKELLRLHVGISSGEIDVNLVVRVLALQSASVSHVAQGRLPRAVGVVSIRSLL